jgi:zinc protease
MTRATLALLLFSSLAGAADRSQPPAPAAPRPVRLPATQRLTLSNGLPVLIVPQHELPTVQLSLVIGTGAASDPVGRPGVAAMTADILDEGAGTRNALELADALDAMGADLGTGSSWDSSSVNLHVPVKRLAEALTLMADVVLRPTFPAPELERLRKEALTELLQLRSEPGGIAGSALAHAIFGAHRYGVTSTAKTVAAITLEDLRHFHATHYRPGNATLLVVGDVEPSVGALLETAFSSWPRGGAPPAALPAPRPLRARSLWLVDRPGAPQSVIRMGHAGPSRTAADYYPREVMSTLLGGLFTSRLNDNLREKHGYAYGASAGFGYRRVSGNFSARTNVQTPSTAPAVTEMLNELVKIHAPAEPDEAVRARSYLALSYPEQFETPGQIAAKLAERVVYGLPEDEFESYVPRVLAVDAAAMQRAAQAIDPDHIAIVVVGDRAKIEAPLRALGIAPLRVVTVDEVLGPAPKLD